MKSSAPSGICCWARSTTAPARGDSDQATFEPTFFAMWLYTAPAPKGNTISSRWASPTQAAPGAKGPCRGSSKAMAKSAKAPLAPLSSTRPGQTSTISPASKARAAKTPRPCTGEGPMRIAPMTPGPLCKWFRATVGRSERVPSTESCSRASQWPSAWLRQSECTVSSSPAATCRAARSTSSGPPAAPLPRLKVASAVTCCQSPTPR
mmetsp:Transcript_6091/g.18331  ORF Transcript_6091/g.18331 Transcript_6091/m.18331 type:complete len:207 (-) Transcript_6091:44-664(-)